MKNSLTWRPQLRVLLAAKDSPDAIDFGKLLFGGSFGEGVELLGGRCSLE